MYEITVDEPQEEKKRKAQITINPYGDWPETFYVKEKDIISMDIVLRFIDRDGEEYIYGNIPYKIEFYDE